MAIIVRALVEARDGGCNSALGLRQRLARSPWRCTDSAGGRASWARRLVSGGGVKPRSDFYPNLSGNFVGFSRIFRGPNEIVP